MAGTPAFCWLAAGQITVKSKREEAIANESLDAEKAKGAQLAPRPSTNQPNPTNQSFRQADLSDYSKSIS